MALVQPVCSMGCKFHSDLTAKARQSTTRHTMLSASFLAD